MEAAILALRSLKGSSRGVLVAGDMLELGEHAEPMHKKIGSLSARSNVAKLYATGMFAKAVETGARDEDMDPKGIFSGTKEEIVSDLTDWLRPGDWILVKGSRAMGMEDIVEKIKEWANN